MDNFRNLTQKYILSNLAHLHGREHVLQDLISFLWGLIINFEIFRLIINILLIKIMSKARKLSAKVLAPALTEAILVTNAFNLTILNSILLR